MEHEKKMAAGAVLAVIGGAGVVLSVTLGWTSVSSPWDFVLGFVFGVMAGMGAALSVFGLIERRARRQ